MSIQSIRYHLFVACIIMLVIFLGLALWSWWFLIGAAVMLPLVLLGLRDITQKRHSLLRNYPVIGHLRFLLEDTGPELRQYIVESNTEGRPFNRDQRSLIYQRAKDVVDMKPFGTELNVYQPGMRWLAHSMTPQQVNETPVEAFRVTVGQPDTPRPYSTSVFNISAMSFGALSPNAIRAMNQGAKLGQFAHVTGEGGLSSYHLEHGGDLIWQIGTGYFGCRTEDGRFDPDLFAEGAAHDAVKMIEIKISQGAKPGHGGVLPAAKITREIADVRRIPMGKDCISPGYHTAFSTPDELCRFVGELRSLSGGKPVGFKLCIGHPEEFLGVCKAILETGIAPDFITVDGAEGGTGAAPVEFSNHIGMPLREALVFVQNALVGAGIRDGIRIAASGKLVTAFEIAQALALGADWCNSARGFMLAVGCIQAQACHTNQCPVGVATQDGHLQKALVVSDKGPRVWHFHRNTLEALADVVAAAGLAHPGDLRPYHIYERFGTADVRTMAQQYDFVEAGELATGNAPDPLQNAWNRASASSFNGVDGVAKM